MSGDHNQNQTDSGWRKRQIALNKKADNAREMGLDYEPNKTVIEMAREAGGMDGWGKHKPSDPELSLETMVFDPDDLERFAELVRADEREACAKVCDDNDPGDGSGYSTACEALAEDIRARGQA